VFLNKAEKLVDNLNLGNFVKKIGDYDVFTEGEIFYRGMSQADYQYLLTNGKIRAPLNSPTSEVFTSPSLEYINFAPVAELPAATINVELEELEVPAGPV
jgi:hypothetical protein